MFKRPPKRKRHSRILLPGILFLAIAAAASWIAWAATFTDTYTTSSNYSVSDSIGLGILGGAAQLLVRHPYHLHNTQTQFDTGTYSDTEILTTDVGSTQSGIKMSDAGLVAYY